LRIGGNRRGGSRTIHVAEGPKLIGRHRGLRLAVSIGSAEGLGRPKSLFNLQFSDGPLLAQIRSATTL
jgi:hypothetical protein